MPEPENWQLQGNAPQMYEEQKVPAMFRPLAEATLRRVDVPEGARVIDLACGTGIVGRLVAGKVGKTGSVVGVDLNAGMIEVAKQSAALAGVAAEWRQGDVCALPLPDAAFDLAFCQKGLQFFPDKLAALREMRRVLAPGGTLVSTVWCSVPPLAAAVAAALTRHLSAETAKSSLVPFVFGDAEVIKALFVDSGFRDIELETFSVERRLGPAAESIADELASVPYANEVAELAKPMRDALINDVTDGLQEFRKDGGFAIPQRTHLFRATA